MKFSNAILQTLDSANYPSNFTSICIVLKSNYIKQFFIDTQTYILALNFTNWHTGKKKLPNFNLIHNC